MPHIQHPNENRNIIIGAPLVLVAFFCFGLFMIHPAGGVGTRSASSQATGSTTDDKTPPVSGTSDDTLVPLALARTDLPTLSPARRVDTSGASIGNFTVSPQVTDGSRSSKSAGEDKSGTGFDDKGQMPVKSSSPSQGGTLQNILNDFLR